MVGVHVPLFATQCPTQCAVAFKLSDVNNICKEFLS